MKNQDFTYKIALTGNPNCGKTSLFNALTGMRQHVANFPGVTVDKKSAKLKIDRNLTVELIDFPGTYSLYPNSDDEKVVSRIFANPADPNYPDAVLYVLDPFDLKRQMLLLTQLADLDLPVLVVVTMKDLAEKNKVTIDTEKLQQRTGIKFLLFSNRDKSNIDDIKKELKLLLEKKNKSVPWYILDKEESEIVDHFKDKLSFNTRYQALVQIHNCQWLDFIDKNTKKEIAEYKKKTGFNSISHQIKETLERYRIIDKKIKGVVRCGNSKTKIITDKIDNIVTHRVLGPVIFFVIMFFVFQAIFSWAQTPMHWLETGFEYISLFIKNNTGSNWFTELLADGVIPGLAGVMVFIPHIFLLFLIIGIMEEVGYMSRVIFMFDDVMRRFGMNGRSMIALISGGACAVPAIMSTRTINNWKERLITIMVTPLISCSARIPVYTLLVGFAVGNTTIMGFNMRGLALMGLYLTGIIMALVSSLVMKYTIKSQGPSFLMVSLPEYKRPIPQNVFLYVKEKVGAFVFGAGKIILIMSVILWFLASYGPPGAMKQAEADAQKISLKRTLTGEQKAAVLSAEKLEHSYIGILGKAIEPAIKPLGFDWKIGIAIISSFAAREIFVGTMATIYSVGSEDDNINVARQMAKDINIRTGEKTYTPAVAWSLLVFYVFALQCMSTIAVVHRELKSWKWPLIQFLYMGALAYIFSFIVYNLLK